VRQVAHGLILRAFIKRWLGYPLDFPLQMVLDPGAIGMLGYVGSYTVAKKSSLNRRRYKGLDIDRPALFVGLALP